MGLRSKSVTLEDESHAKNQEFIILARESRTGFGPAGATAMPLQPTQEWSPGRRDISRASTRTEEPDPAETEPQLSGRGRVVPGVPRQ